MAPTDVDEGKGSILSGVQVVRGWRSSVTLSSTPSALIWKTRDRGFCGLQTDYHLGTSVKCMAFRNDCSAYALLTTLAEMY